MTPGGRSAALAAFYAQLSPDSVARVGEFYAPTARFVDPFNDVRGPVAIERIFVHMFTQVDSPRFEVSSIFETADEGVLVWVMRWGDHGRAGRIEGTSHVRFDFLGRVIEHRDYWDPTPSIYASIPLLGLVMRRIRCWLSAH
jgi:steroid delta-isomerase